MANVYLRPAFGSAPDPSVATELMPSAPPRAAFAASIVACWSAIRSPAAPKAAADRVPSISSKLTKPPEPLAVGSATGVARPPPPMTCGPVATPEAMPALVDLKPRPDFVDLIPSAASYTSLQNLTPTS